MQFPHKSQLRVVAVLFLLLFYAVYVAVCCTTFAIPIVLLHIAVVALFVVVVDVYFCRYTLNR